MNKRKLKKYQKIYNEVEFYEFEEGFSKYILPMIFSFPMKLKSKSQKRKDYLLNNKKNLWLFYKKKLN